MDKNKMTDKQTHAIAFLFNELQRVRGIDFSAAPSIDNHLSTKGKFKGQTVALVGLSAVNGTFPDVVISQRGAYEMESVSSYPESKAGSSRYDANLPATALSACLYGDKHLAKVAYGVRTPKASTPAIPASVGVEVEG